MEREEYTAQEWLEEIGAEYGLRWTIGYFYLVLRKNLDTTKNPPRPYGPLPDEITRDWTEYKRANRWFLKRKNTDSSAGRTRGTIDPEIQKLYDDLKELDPMLLNRLSHVANNAVADGVPKRMLLEFLPRPEQVTYRNERLESVGEEESWCIFKPVAQIFDEFGREIKLGTFDWSQLPKISTTHAPPLGVRQLQALFLRFWELHLELRGRGRKEQRTERELRLRQFASTMLPRVTDEQIDEILRLRCKWCCMPMSRPGYGVNPKLCCNDVCGNQYEYWRQKLSVLEPNNQKLKMQEKLTRNRMAFDA